MSARRELNVLVELLPQSKVFMFGYIIAIENIYQKKLH